MTKTRMAAGIGGVIIAIGLVGLVAWFLFRKGGLFGSDVGGTEGGGGGALAGQTVAVLGPDTRRDGGQQVVVAEIPAGMSSGHIVDERGNYVAPLGGLNYARVIPSAENVEVAHFGVVGRPGSGFSLGSDSFTPYGSPYAGPPMYRASPNAPVAGPVPNTRERGLRVQGGSVLA